MRYMPTLRSPVSGSRVTTHGRVMNLPPSSGQHLRMGRFASVGGVAEVGGNWTGPAGRGAEGKGGRGDFASASFPLFSFSSKRWITSLHAPSFTTFGLA